ncbi:TIGR04283 family arsenosugar biosynthesis glycosyltransferase [Rubrivirga sp. S365]|uniref:TIGR04283 family arsenosugar biosynthesis glycosyltransferase n=1 Tax=Rubrivirga litoralis TaxID=3075598 RepID=A0ABU3BMF1_9BACT|nr:MULTISPECIES: TIGR04283 family arsenosugar biosynthesis glycosyltransferase [unclassified Rubrivirga]MDT0630469.1 TIGR04283 family arsenosugar biosynthesis glycosyltransferase [Rubrivirga sp. F394]MDT7857553.1 TIGR04283 family arsenosugar biosynthesis glycosyltransferase [Rubrivirga sp. S365]
MNPTPQTVTVVIPALNEAAGIGRTLASVAAQPGPVEVVVVDGGSTDGTAAAVHPALASARVIASERGRARQMNAGAAHGRGGALLFLHADTALPPGALDRVRRALAEPGVAGGCFAVTFDRPAPGEPAFGPLGRAAMRLWEARLWMRWHRLAFGDRALFVRRDVFDAVGGFPEQPIFEDLDAVRAVRRRGRFVFLDAAVVTSARRFRRGGAVRQQLRNLALWAAWNAGVPPARLKRFYPD